MSEKPVNVPLIIAASALFIGAAILTTQWAYLLFHNFMRLPPW